MLVRKIKNHTNVIGADQGYLSLPIRVESIQLETAAGTWNTFRVLSAWEPTPKELERIIAGDSIILSLIAAHPIPPIEMTVETAERVEGVNELHASIEDMIDSVSRYISALRAQMKKAPNDNMNKIYFLRIKMYEQLVAALQEELAG